MDFIGTITPPPFFPNDTETALGSLIGKSISIALLVAGFLVLVFMLLGAFQWVTSGGDKEKLARAQSRITQAVVGLLMIFVALVIFGLIVGDVLGIIKKNPDGSWVFTLPVFGEN